MIDLRKSFGPTMPIEEALNHWMDEHAVYENMISTSKDYPKKHIWEAERKCRENVVKLLHYKELGYTYINTETLEPVGGK